MLLHRSAWQPTPGKPQASGCLYAATHAMVVPLAHTLHRAMHALSHSQQCNLCHANDHGRAGKLVLGHTGAAVTHI